MMQSALFGSMVAPVTVEDDDDRIQVYRVGSRAWLENWVSGEYVEVVITGIDPSTGNIEVRFPGGTDKTVLTWDEGLFAREEYVDPELVKADTYRTSA